MPTQIDRSLKASLMLESGRSYKGGWDPRIPVQPIKDHAGADE